MSKKISFEDKLEELENIVKRLENGEAGLEETMKLYSDGLNLSNELEKLLSKTEEKLKVLSSDKFEELDENEL